MKFNTIDLFCGCGGLTEGFLRTGNFSTLAAVDWEIATVKTLMHRLSSKWGYKDSSKRTIHFDIRRTLELINGFDDEVYGKHSGLKKLIGNERVDLIIGGPPCQAYSIAGRVRDENGMQDDYRNYLFESYVKLVDFYKPKAFVFENVEGILSAKPGGLSIIERIKSSFNEIGYEITNNLKKHALFDTSYYNVPQKRKRVIIFGVPKSDNCDSTLRQFYLRMKLRASKTALSSENAFKNLPKFIPNDKSSNHSHKAINVEFNKIPNHEPRKHNQRDIEIFRLLTKDIEEGINKYKSTKALIELYKEKTGKDSKFHKYHVIRKDRPSNTIPAHLYKDGLRHIHPDSSQSRTITVREAARLQTFSDDFEFLGSRSDQYKMVGNAVPPNFSKIIAEIITEILK